MPKGFFVPPTTEEPLTSFTPHCGACGLFEHCKSPKMPWTGKGKENVLVVAEAPGKNEDMEGVQLVGKAGKRFRRELKGFGWDLDRDCWKTNALICYPEDGWDSKQIGYCRPNLMNTIKEIKPHTVLLLGAAAVESLVGGVWCDDIGRLERWVGWQIPSQSLNAWICPTYHPSYLERRDDPVLDLWFRRHLESAMQLEGRPWEEVPNHSGQVRLLFDSSEAAEVVMNINNHCSSMSFDFETNSLKPDWGGARIVSCAVAWNDAQNCIAFPWYGPVVEEMGKLLRNPKVKKIGQNIKFEDRWCRRVFNHPVSGWVWDTMQATHVLDNRQGITSLKFQSFVRLGERNYEEQVKPFLEAEGSYTSNRIDEVPIEDLLLYNGLDALLTFKIAEIQKKEMK
jgi:DNA polymerase